MMKEIAMLKRLRERCEDGDQWAVRIDQRLMWLRKKLEADSDKR
jgi:hypothetical protein